MSIKQVTQQGQDSEAHFLAQPLPATLLKLLLTRLQITVQMGALIDACEQAQAQLAGASPAKRISFIAQILKLPGMQAVQLRWCRFDQRRLPALLFHQGEWQLIEPARGATFTLTNQAQECQVVTEQALEQGIVLWLHSPEKHAQTDVFSLRGNVAARLVFTEMFKTRRWVIDIIIATVIINCLAVTTSLFAMQVYDRVVPTLAYATLTTLVSGMFIIVSLDWLLKTVRARTLDSVSSAVDKAVSQQVFEHVIHLQLDTRPRTLGTLSAQVAGLDSVRQFFSSAVIFALIDMPFALFFIAFIGIIGGPIGWVYLSLLPIAILLGWVTQHRLRRLLKQQMVRANERQGLLVDVIQGAESIRANNANWRFAQVWQEITATIASYSIRQKAISSFATVTTGSLATCAYVSAIVVGVGQIEAGNLTMGALIACSILGGRVIAPVSQSIQYLAQWQGVSQSLQMVNQVLLLKRERQRDQTLLLPDQLATTLALDEVTFCYPESPLKSLNINALSVKSGERVVILGAIGCGKSTLLKVLAGLYRPSTGRVRLGNADIWQVDPNVVAQHISYLPQTVHLFKGTLTTNLLLGGSVSDSQLLEVVQSLAIDAIVATSPMGMDLPISEGGKGLSGGQRQLLGLGRVFLAQPKIWLLDEPTASLDNETERQILQAIKRYVKADDILIIATHRPAIAAQLATRVIVMDKGEISADGKPEVVLTRTMRRHAANPAAPQAFADSENDRANNVDNLPCQSGVRPKVDLPKGVSHVI